MQRIATQLDAAAPPAELEHGGDSGKRLPYRDYFILPLLSILTLVLLFGIVEIACRMIWPSVEDSCHNHPNCVTRGKFAEGPWVEYKYNECGYRNADSCKSKPAGTFRVVLLGSSIVNGWGVPYEHTLVPLVSENLSGSCGRKVEIQNVSATNNMLDVYRHADEVLSLNPDLVVLLFGAGDMHVRFDPQDLANRDNPAFTPSSAVVMPPLRQLGGLLISSSRAMLMAKHFLYQTPSYSLKAIVIHPLDVDYMVTPPPEQWTKRLSDLDVLIGGMAEKFRAHKVPFALVPTVNTSQALLLSSYPNLAGFDPREFEKDVDSIGRAHNVTVLNIYEDFTQARSDLLFYSGDGHPNTAGYSVLSHGLTRELLTNGLLGACKPR